MMTKDDIADLMSDIFLDLDWERTRDLVVKDCQWLRDKAHNEYAQRSTDEEDNALANFERFLKSLPDKYPVNKYYGFILRSTLMGYKLMLMVTEVNERELKVVLMMPLHI
jgi:hypothetical protein